MIRLSFSAFFCLALFCLGKIDAFAQIRREEDSRNKIEWTDTASLMQMMGMATALLPNHSDSATQLLYTVLEQSLLIHFPAGRDTALSVLSRHWYKKTLNDQQFPLMEKIIRLVEQEGKQSRSLALLYYVTGDYHLDKGLYPQSLLYLQKALGALTTQSDRKSSDAIRTLIYNKIGAVWILLKEPAQAMLWWDKAEHMAREQKDLHRLIAILRNKGTYYFETGQLDTSYRILIEAYDLGRQNPEIHTHCGCIRYTVSALCMTLLTQGKAMEAMAYLDEDISYVKGAANHADKTSGSHVNSSLLHLYFLKAYAFFIQKKYPSAERLLLPTLRHAQEQHIQVVERNVLGLLSMLYGATGQYKKAFEYLNAYNVKEKSMVKDQKGSAVDFHIQYLKNEKEKEMAQKQLVLSSQMAQIRNRNMILMVSLGTIFLLCLLFGVVYYNIKRRQRLLQELVEIKAIMQGEEKERARLAHELHDGIVIQFSAVKMNLSTLPDKYEGLTGSSEYQGILRSLDDATRELRKTAHHLMPDMLLEEGLAGASYYFCRTLVQQAGLAIHFQHYGDLPRMEQEFELSLYRIIQELVQNIVKHAQASSAMVQLSYHNEQLNITIEDNGRGFDLRAPAAERGMGLRSIRARVKALRGHLDLQSAEGKGTIAYMEFDCVLRKLGKNKE